MDLQKAIKYFGSKSAIAKALKISRAAVSKWEVIPPRRVFELKELMRKKKATNAN